jgi:site-specific recombinase XerC
MQKNFTRKIRTGSRMGRVLLEKMAERWDELARKRPLAPSYYRQCVSHMNRFLGFLSDRYSSVREMADVQAIMAHAFMRSEEERGVTGKTYYDILKLFRSYFHRLRKEAGITENPFDGIPTRDDDTIHRMPFSNENQGSARMRRIGVPIGELFTDYAPSLSGLGC